MGLKLAPVSVSGTDILLAVVVVGGVYVLYTAAVKFEENLSAAKSAVSDFIDGGAVRIAAGAVDMRTTDQNPNDLSLGGVQQAVANAVQRGQDAGATNFLSAYLKGIFL